WVPSFGGDWQTTNLSDLYGGPTLGAGISSYVTSWDGLNIAGVDGDGNVQIYWWAPGLDVWNVTAISDLVTDVDAPAGNLTGFASPTGTINLAGLASDGDLVRYSWDANGDQIWRGVNLSETSEYRV
ncbi:MAG: hypothetical protein KDA28_14270, partial [Phycisphaerales bacterium]|nr:hypothetical protein [Phycisphaerales bacterium]